MSLVNPVITVHKDASDIPEKVWKTFPRTWSKNLGEPFGVVFPLFAKAFPQTTLAIEAHWSRPVFKTTVYSWQDYSGGKIYCTEGNKTLFLAPSTSKEEFLIGDYFDQSAEMLPLRWKELYRWFNSFSIVEGQEHGRYWINTPFGFETRSNAEEYVQKSKADKSAARVLEKFIGSSKTQIMCWLYTDAGDALFLDEARNDHKVYHVNKSNIKDIAVLPNPEDKLDEYLAHYVSGGAPKDFNFR
jgi:hypothetical protein